MVGANPTPTNSNRTKGGNKEMTEKWTEHFNNIYTNGGGFYGVIEEIEDKLHLGRVTKFEIEGAELPSKELQDFNKFFELNDVRVFFHKKKNMIRLAGNFFMNKKLIAVSNALFKGGVIESYTFSRNERLQQSELRLMFKEVEDE